LAAANARISALEAELNAAREAWEGTNAVKVAAEKVAKSVETKAKKAEKALSDADQKRVQQERAIAERLDKISILVDSKYCVCLFWLLAQICIADILFAFFGLFLCGAAEKIGVSWKLRQPDTEDPLLVAVDLLESNWKLVQEVLQLTRRVLMQMFIRLWPKKKEEMPVDNLQKLAAAIDTLEDPVLAMKGRSVKRGVEGAIALAQSHGKQVDWEKISSSCAHPLSELLGFFKKAKKYAPGIVSIITPSTASSNPAPSSSTPSPSTSMPPPSAAADSSAPSTATEPTAVVA
jgi:hypothetical protein